MPDSLSSDSSPSTHSSPSTNPSQTSPAPEKDLYGLLFWLVKKGPLWARIPAVTAAIVAALVSPIHEAWSHFSTDSTRETQIDQKQPAASQLDMATSAKASADEQLVESSIEKPNLTADEKLKLEAMFGKLRHEIAHLSNVKDAVPWITFAKKSPTDYFGYKFFPSDKCLLIARIENGQGTSEWLTDPNRPIVTAASTVPQRVPTSKKLGASTDEEARFHFIEAALSGATISLPPDVVRRETNSNQIEVPATVTEFQGGCLNPHPGNFEQTAGAPINGCQTPIFRRWADGCAHTQIYDHCQNVWGPVVWQFCANFHHL